MLYLIINGNVIRNGYLFFIKIVFIMLEYWIIFIIFVLI